MSVVKINDSVWKSIMRRVNGLSNKAVKVGVFENAGETEDGLFTLAELAAVHEFGMRDETIPERSFIRATFREKEKELREFSAKLTKKIIENGLNEDRALALLGEWGAAEIKKYVTKGPHIPPPLQQSTIDAKGSDKPLIDTGRMIDAVTYVVEDE